MNKTKLFAFALILAAIALAGCSKGQETAAGGGSSSDTRVELTVWESGDGLTFIEQAGEAFAALYPNVTIRCANVSHTQATTQITLDGPAGVGPDVFIAPHDRLGELVVGGHILPTRNPQAVADAVIESCSQALMYEGVMYGYPVAAETYALFYNRALIRDEDVPATWEGMRDFAAAFNAENPGKYAFVMDVGSSECAYYSIVFTTMRGNRLFGPSGNDISATYLNTEAAIEGMTFYQSLRQVLDVPAADLTSTIADAAFLTGNAAMHITGPWNVSGFLNAGIDFGITTLPSLPGESEPAASFSGTRAMFVSAYSEHPEEATAFAEFLVTPEMQRLRAEVTQTLPAISVEDGGPYVTPFLQQLEYAFPMPSIPEAATFFESFGNASVNIWNGADVRSEVNAADAAILSSTM